MAERDALRGRSCASPSVKPSRASPTVKSFERLSLAVSDAAFATPVVVANML